MKKEILKIQCSCGQENHLVKLEDSLHYDADKHGNGEPCNNECFNCHASLGLEPEPRPSEERDKPAEEPVDDTVEEAVDPATAQALAETSETTEEAIAAQDEMELAAMNRTQLQERARELEITLPFVITNEGIRNLIRAKSNGR